MTIDFTRVWNWYSRESVQRAILEVARDREVVSIYKDGAFGKRPNVLNHPGDILQAVAEGSVSFHGSVERWTNPMRLEAGMSKQDQDSLRTGWDVFIDPDVPDFEIAKMTVRHIYDALKDHGVSSCSVKFSGGKSFHMGIPFESVPEKINFQQTSQMYPEMTQKVTEFLKWYVRDSLKEEMLSLGQPNVISQRVNKPVADITGPDGLDPFKVVNMDVFSSRHLFRLPYSLHEKSLLVSMPLRMERLQAFEKEMAAPEKVKIDEKFLVPRSPSKDAEALIVEALDWAGRNKVEVKEPVAKEAKKFGDKPMRYVSEDLFPPCIKHMLGNGLGDGKKRGLFILVNFLRNMGWSPEQIEKRLDEWNQKNSPPLRTNYVRGQLRWHFRNEKPMLPPNCDNENYYKQLGLHGLCRDLHDAGVKNPVSYPFRLLKAKSDAKRAKKGKKGGQSRKNK
jgi:hypothetical protein